jgi:hypothetical protein
VTVDAVDITAFPAANVDSVIHGLITIDAAHHEVHEGEMFYAEHTASVNNGANMDMLLTIGAKEAHLVFNVSAGGQSSIYLYESPTVANGTTVPVYNMKRASLTAALTTVKHTPSVSGVGATPLVNGRVVSGGTSPTTRVGGGIRSGTEWILKPSTSYLLRVTNDSGSTVLINTALEFYEETV